MITLFRRIRQKLVESGSVTRYLLYAIGEILLVVMGILIALQVNNWNNQRNEQRISEDYHQRMIIEIDQLVSSLNREIGRSSSIAQNLSKSVFILEGETRNDSTTVILDNALSRYAQMSSLSLQLASYEEMKSSGQLNMIYDTDLRQKLNGYSLYAGAVTNIIDQLSEEVSGSDYLMNRYIRIYISNIENRRVKYDVSAISKDPVFINTISKFSSSWYAYNYFLTDIVEQLSELEELVKLELRANW